MSRNSARLVFADARLTAPVSVIDITTTSREDRYSRALSIVKNSKRGSCHIFEFRNGNTAGVTRNLNITKSLFIADGVRDGVSASRNRAGYATDGTLERERCNGVFES